MTLPSPRPRPAASATVAALALETRWPLAGARRQSSGPVVAPQDDPVVARVNGVEIRQSDLALAEEDVGTQCTQMPPEAKRDYLVTFVADMILVAKAARRRRSPTAGVQAAARLHAQQAADGALLQGEAKAARHRRGDAQGL